MHNAKNTETVHKRGRRKKEIPGEGFPSPTLVPSLIHPASNVFSGLRRVADPGLTLDGGLFIVLVSFHAFVGGGEVAAIS